MKTFLKWLVLPLLGVAGLNAAAIHGTIIIKHKLTKRTVTPSAGAYDRGVSVGLGADRPTDPLAFERTHVVVYIEGALPSAPVTAELAQKERRFIPDLLVVPVGSTVSFPNFDPIFHNVFSLSKPKSFDLGNYPQGQTRKVVFAKPGVVLVNCHLHSNMAAVIFVTPNPWFTQPGDDGAFTLDKLPPGTYHLVAWHKAAGYFRKTVTVTSNQDASVDFVVPLDENGQMPHSLASR